MIFFGGMTKIVNNFAAIDSLLGENILIVDKLMGYLSYSHCLSCFGSSMERLKIL